MKAFYIFLSLTLFAIPSLNGQSSVYGKVIDGHSGESLIYANVVLFKNNVFATGGNTDLEGNYSIPLDPGKYSLHVNYSGYPSIIIQDVYIEKNRNTKVDIFLPTVNGPGADKYLGYKVPNIEQENNANSNTLSPKKPEDASLKELSKLLASKPHCGPSQEEGYHVTIGRSREKKIDYYIDGVRFNGNKIIHFEPKDSLEVMIPLNDLLGGTSVTEDFENSNNK